jgi:peptidoglycan/xylan/chitin deacetylase (PgdA/CDA1 family)
MPLDLFARRMELIQQGGYPVLGLDEAIAQLAAGTLPPGSVVLTFDDGMYNFHRQALPVLERYGFPATVYLTTNYAGNNMPVFPLVWSYLLWKGKSVPVPAEAGPSAIAKNSAARELAKQLGVDYEQIERERIFNLMNESEVREIARRGIDVQLHTHRHRTPADRMLYREEVDTNARAIQSWTGRTPAHFCYPSGCYSPDSLMWLREMEIRSAVTCEPGLANRRHDPLLLPRLVDTCLFSEIEFESWLCGAGSFLPRRSPNGNRVPAAARESPGPAWAPTERKQPFRS